MVVAFRPPRDARRPGGLRCDATLARELHRDLPRARDDAGYVRAATRPRRRDVQPGCLRRERWRCVHRSRGGPLTGLGRSRAVRWAAGFALVCTSLLGFGVAWTARPLPGGMLDV